MNPKFVQGLSNLGASYIELGKENLAVDILKKARVLDPESQLVANNYATALRGVGRIEESIAILKSIKNEEDPLLDDPAIQAQQYRIAGKFELAEKAYRDAIKKDPLDVSLYANFGSLLIERKKFDEAEIVLKKAIDTNRAGAITHMNLGFLYLKKKNFPQAQIQSEIAVKLNPESSISWLNLGLAYVHQEKIDQAREAWTRALALDPNNEQLKNNLKVVEDR